MEIGGLDGLLAAGVTSEADDIVVEAETGAAVTAGDSAGSGGRPKAAPTPSVAGGGTTAELMVAGSGGSERSGLGRCHSGSGGSGRMPVGTFQVLGRRGRLRSSRSDWSS